MDTTKQYIEMSRQAQKYLSPRAEDICKGDTIFYDGNWGVYFKEHFYLEGVYSIGDLIIWEREIFKLYHQDQLQEIQINKNKKDKWIYWGEQLDRFNIFVCEPYPTEFDGVFKTWEQIWLAYVMNAKFNRTWDGTDWIKEGK